jgi:mannose-1-phosphate guanylyltransferase/mannose-6-phosphate isomerase
LSREYYPKQFLKFGESSLFQDTVKRCLRISNISEIFVVTNESQKFFVIGQMEELGLSLQKNNLLIEPEGKNTLPAICFGMREIEKIFGKSDVGIFSSDHIMDMEAMDTIAAAKDLAKEYLVTFGIVPKSPHTGYGYLKPGEAVGAGYRVSEFKEKPDIEQAKKYVENGYLWNSGMFLFNTEVFSSELSKHAPELLEAFTPDRNINEIYRDISAISVDYGLLEKSDNVAVVRLDVKWSDLGNFDAMYNEFEKDEFGNVEFGCESISKDSYGNIIQSTKEKVVSLIDVDNMVVIDTSDALLVCPRSSSQKVKDIVGVLKDRNDERASFHRTVYRPWGSYTIMEDSERYKIKKIRVIPGKTLSLQLHHHRSEHWVMVTGTACVYVDKKKFFLRQGESTFIKPGVKHRLSNPGKFALEIIEVQLGEYVGEDDIIRFEDEYGRD